MKYSVCRGTPAGAIIYSPSKETLNSFTKTGYTLRFVRYGESDRTENYIPAKQMLSKGLSVRISP